jgi:uncharacterized membrane protein
MHIAVQGALVGLGLAVFLFMFEYLAIKSAGAARAKKMAKKAEIIQEERSRLRGMMMFCFCLPPGMAIIFWLTMG